VQRRHAFTGEPDRRAVEVAGRGLPALLPAQGRVKGGQKPSRSDP
jgi:hypothetical protein